MFINDPLSINYLLVSVWGYHSGIHFTLQLDILNLVIYKFGKKPTEERGNLTNL